MDCWWHVFDSSFLIVTLCVRLLQYKTLKGEDFLTKEVSEKAEKHKVKFSRNISRYFCPKLDSAAVFLRLAQLIAYILPKYLQAWQGIYVGLRRTVIYMSTEGPGLKTWARAVKNLSSIPSALSSSALSDPACAARLILSSHTGNGNTDLLCLIPIDWRVSSQFAYISACPLPANLNLCLHGTNLN